MSMHGHEKRSGASAQPLPPRLQTPPAAVRNHEIVEAGRSAWRLACQQDEICFGFKPPDCTIGCKPPGRPVGWPAAVYVATNWTVMSVVTS